MSLLFVVHHFVNILSFIIYVLYFTLICCLVVPMSVRAATGLDIVLPIMLFLIRLIYLSVVMHWFNK
jgi:hypothetical protein